MATVNIGEVLVKLRADVKQFEKSMAMVRRRLNGIKDASVAVARSVGIATAAFAGLVAALGKLTQRGGEVINVQRAFGKASGNTASALNKLRDTTKGLISDYQIMAGFNRAVALGSARNTREFSELATTAITLGRALGVDATFALESLNLGIGRQSRLILDNLGLIVSVEKANKDYAAALGITVKELSVAQQREAFRTAALESARTKIEELGGVQLNAADNVTRLTVAFANFRDTLGQILATSDEVGGFFDSLTLRVRTLASIAEGLSDIPLQRELAAISQLPTQAAAGSLAALEAETARRFRAMGQKIADEFELGELVDPEVQARIRDMADDFAAMGPARARIKAAGDLVAILDQIEIAELRREEALKRMVELRRQEALALEDIAASVPGALPSIMAPETIGPITEDVKELTDAQMRMAAVTGGITDQTENIRFFFEQFKLGTLTVEELSAALDMLGLSTQEIRARLTALLDELVAGLEASGAVIDRATTASIEALRLALSQAGGDVTDQLSALEKGLARIGKTAGESFIFGIIDGVNSASDILKQALKALISLILAQVMGPAGLGILSPSTKGKFIGEMFGKGMAIGIDTSLPEVVGASGRMASAAVGGAVPTLNLTVDTSGLSRPTSPREAALQAETIELFIETFRNAQDLGFKP